MPSAGSGYGRLESADSSHTYTIYMFGKVESVAGSQVSEVGFNSGGEVDVNKAVEIADGVYWVGYSDESAGLRYGRSPESYPGF
ncbi:MAG TPA: hypothetical protein GXX51_11620 [Firmicutes bacterium]|nr:hypothetical protein [Bacillota bacterium]